MKTQFPYDLSRLKINAQDPVEYERIQNDILRQAISRSTAIAEISEKRLAALTEMVERRTQIFSPTKGYSHQNYQRSLSMTQGPTASSCSYLFQLGLLGLLDLILFVCAAGTNYSLPLQILSAPTRPPENIGVYVSEDDGQLRAYINDLPSSTLKHLQLSIAQLQMMTVRTRVNDHKLIWFFLMLLHFRNLVSKSV